MAVLAGSDENVRRERGKARRDRPHVEVVHLDHPRRRGKPLPELGCVDSPRGRLEEDRRRVAQDRPRAREDEEADEDAHERIGLDPSGREDHDCRNRDAERAEEVSEDVAEGRFDVEAVTPRSREDDSRRNVHRHADERDREHPATEDIAGVAQPHGRLHEDPDRERDEQHTVCERGENLRALVADRCARASPAWPRARRRRARAREPRCRRACARRPRATRGSPSRGRRRPRPRCTTRSGGERSRARGGSRRARGRGRGPRAGFVPGGARSLFRKRTASPMRHHRGVRLRILALVALVGGRLGLLGRDHRRREHLGERPAVVHERLHEVATDQQEAVHEHRSSLERPLRGEERLREQEEGRQAVSERHGDREVDPARGRQRRFPRRSRSCARRTARWRYVEYELSGSRYRDLGFSQGLCQGCHMRARANDYVFTRK